MTMEITRIATYWTAAEADAVVAFLDELKDMLWQTYGDQITEMRRAALVTAETDTDQPASAFDDTIDF